MAEQFDAITKARTALIYKHPFFGVLALQLRLQRDDNLESKTMAVDGKTIFWYPAFVDSLKQSQIEGVLCHELLHCVYDHITRIGARDVMRWRYACDYAINGLLHDMKFDLPEPHLYDKKYDNMSADEIYNLLPESLPAPPDLFVCEIRDGAAGGGEGSAQASELRTSWKVAVTQAALLAQQQGAMPSQLRRFADELTEPQVNWRDQLRHLMTQTRAVDYSWSKLSKRGLANDIYLPQMDGQASGHIVVAIDTSGSITQKMLGVFGSEISDISKSVRPEKLTVIYCDADIAHVDEFTEHDELHFDMHGGGGTDFRPPFMKLAEDDTTPMVLVYLTDGYGPFPTDAPSYPVVWCMTTEVKPPWGEIVEVKA